MLQILLSLISYSAHAVRASIYIYIYINVDIICLWIKKNLNGTLAIDPLFQTFAVGLSHRIYRLALPLLSPEMLSSSSKLRII